MKNSFARFAQHLWNLDMPCSSLCLVNNINRYVTNNIQERFTKALTI